MTNQLLTSEIISNAFLASFVNNTPFLMTASHDFEGEFIGGGYKKGATFQVRRQNAFLVGDGQNATLQDIIETDETITINHQYHIFVPYTIQDLTLRIEEFSKKIIQPSISEITTKMETDIGIAAEQSLYYFSGSASSAVNSFANVEGAGMKLLEQGVNISDDAYMALSIRDGGALKAGLVGNFTPVLNEEIVRKSSAGHVSYFDTFQSQNIKVHTAGAGPRTASGDTLTVSGEVSSGNTITLTGATNLTNYFVAGDVISIAGVQSVNPRGRAATGQNSQFLITQNATSSGGNVTITVSPSIISDTANPLRNVSNPIPNAAVVTVVGNHKVNAAYPRNGLSIICPPLQKLQVPFWGQAVDPKTGISLTICQDGDIQAYQNTLRVDVLCGFKWHPQYCVRHLSSV